MPITPACQPSAREHVSRARAGSAICASASKRIRSSIWRRSGFAASSSCGDLRRRGRRPRSGSARGGIGAVEPPGGVQARRQRRSRPRARPRARGPRPRPPSARAGPGLVVAASARSPRRASERFSPRSGTTSAIVASATRSRSCASGARQRRRAVGAAGFEQRLRELVGDRRRAQLGARVAADARVHDRRRRQRAVGRGVWWSVTTTSIPSSRAARDLLDGGDRAVDGDQQPRAARREPATVARSDRSRRARGRAGTSRRRRQARAARARAPRSSRCRRRRSRRGRDPLAGARRARENRADRLLDAREAARRGAPRRPGRRARRADRQAAAHQHLRQRALTPSSRAGARPPPAGSRRSRSGGSDHASHTTVAPGRNAARRPGPAASGCAARLRSGEPGGRSFRAASPRGRRRAMPMSAPGTA